MSEVVDRVATTHDRVVVTRNGRPAAVLMSPDDLAALEETLAILSDPDSRARIDEARQALANGGSRWTPTAATTTRWSVAWTPPRSWSTPFHIVRLGNVMGSNEEEGLRRPTSMRFRPRGSHAGGYQS